MLCDDNEERWMNELRAIGCGMAGAVSDVQVNNNPMICNTFNWEFRTAKLIETANFGKG